MRTLTLISFIFIIVAISCEKNEDTTPKVDKERVNQIFDAGDYKEQVPDKKTDVKTGDTIKESAAKEGYIKKTVPHKLTNSLETYQPLGKGAKKSSAEMYPGAIIQGKYWFENAELVSYGDFDGRKEVMITIKGVDLGEENISKKVYPSNSDMEKALQTMFEGKDNLAGKQEWNYKQTIAYSKKQSMLNMGLSADWIAGGFASDFNFENKVEQNSILINFRQNYFTVSIEEPTSPSDFFSGDTDLDQLEQTITEDNPAGYISTITYGRTLTVEMTSNYSYEDMKGALSAEFGGLGANWSSNVSGEKKQILEQSSYKINVNGGPVQDVPNNYEGIKQFINKGMSLGNYHNAVPVSYTVKYLKDKAPFHIKGEAEYNKVFYEKVPIEEQKLGVYLVGFYILNDGDLWSDGDFSYSVTIDWGSDYKYYSGEKNIGSEEWLALDKNIEFYLPKREGEKFTVYATLKEDDDLVGEVDLEFSYPWNNEDMNPDVLTRDGNNYKVNATYMKYSNNLDATFYIQAVKLEEESKTMTKIKTLTTKQ